MCPFIEVTYKSFDLYSTLEKMHYLYYTYPKQKHTVKINRQRFRITGTQASQFKADGPIDLNLHIK